jgi:hypothetical protein
LVKNKERLCKGLLPSNGCNLALESDVHGDDIAQGAYYEYQSQSGFVRSDIGKISGNTIQRMLEINTHFVYLVKNKERLCKGLLPSNGCNLALFKFK